MTYFYPRPPRGGRLRWLFPSPRSSYFYPRPPRGGRLMRMYILSSSSVFLSTPSARRATCRLSARWCRLHYFYPRPPRGGRPALRDSCGLIRLISIHALREEGDQLARVSVSQHNRFLSTPSARRATGQLTQPVVNQDDFYPRPPRGGRPYMDCINTAGDFISIHALREEGDVGRLILSHKQKYFYPRPPRGGRPLFRSLLLCSMIFLSTPSARRATT